VSEARNFFRFITFLGAIISVLVLIGLLFAGTCKAQGEAALKSLLVYGFKGLNTAEGIYVATPDYAATSINVDYSRYGKNTIGKRHGFDSLYVVSGIDSIVGLGTYQRANRQSCLVYAVDDSTKGYGAIYATRYGSDNPDSATKIKDFWSIQNATRFSQYNDNLYATNGQQAGMVWSGTRARSFPIPTPGMPDIIPLKTSGNLNGEYRYCIYQVSVYRSGSATTWFAGTLSPAIHVVNGRVLLRRFSRPITSGMDTIVTSVDSAILWLGRTKANPGPIDDEDTIWLLSSIHIKVGTDSTRADTVTYTDNTADASLSNYISPANFRLALGRDSTKTITGRRWGAPTYVSADSTTSGSNVLYPGSLTGARNILGYAYVVTCADTLLGLESDSTRALWVRTKPILPAGDSTTSLRRITIGLPRMNAYDSNYVLNIYRANLLVFGRKYWNITINGDTIWEDQPGTIDRIWDFRRKGVRIDSTKAIDFYRVAQVPTSRLTYVDSVRQDTLFMRGQRFNLSTQPEIFSQMFQWRSKLGGVAGSRIWFSSQFVDSQGNFGTNDFDDFNRNDGDFITGVKEKQFGLAVKKNRSAYVLPNGGGRPEKVSTFGCVAPLSYISSDFGDLFVGDGGVYLETEGQSLERIYNAGLVSEKLNNFVNMPDSVRRNVVAFWIPDKRQAIFSADFPATANDTAYVLDFKSGQTWTTWTNLVPKFGCLYSTNSTLGSPPPQTFYFTKAGGKTIYTYATQDYDCKFDVMAPVTYETVLLFPDPDYDQVSAVGVVSNGFISSGSFDAIVYDQKWYRSSSTIRFDSLGYLEGTSTGALAGPTYSYHEFDAPPMRAARLRFFTGSTDYQMIAGAIESFELLYRKVERTGLR